MGLIINWYLDNLAYTLLLSVLLVSIVVYLLGLKFTNLPYEKLGGISGAIGSIPAVIFFIFLINQLKPLIQNENKISPFWLYLIVLLMPIIIYFLAKRNIRQLLIISKEAKERKRLRKLDKENKNKS